MHIGLFFGSFNPIHTGHLIIANHILNTTALKRIWFVVSPQNPLKSDDELLNENYRLNLVRIATSADDRIKVSNIEFKLSKPSYTINTLSYLKEKYPNHEFSIIMGSDSFQTLDKWKSFEEIIVNYKIFIYRRPGFDMEIKMKGKMEILRAPLIGISSTEIRELIRNGKSIRYLVPQKVRREIENNNYYKK
ncbi:MAG: nicotinate (nicotinamide) nucleotide adenylyltransferase [Chitinophagales bacterium]